METDNLKDTDADADIHATDDRGPQASSLPESSGYLVPFNEKDVLFPADVEPPNEERRRYIIAEFNLVKRRMREEEEKHRPRLPGEPSVLDNSERSGLDKIEIGKSTLKGWRKLLEAPIDFTWERPGLSDNNAHFEQDQQDVAIMYTFHDYLDESHRDRCTKKGRLATAILTAIDEGVMDDILASPPASDSTSESPTSRSPGSSRGQGPSLEGNGDHDSEDDSGDEGDDDNSEGSSNSSSGSDSSSYSGDGLMF